jgi:hypothetical protein
MASAGSARQGSTLHTRRAAALLDHFQFLDIAIGVGGVGSVGTRCSVTLLPGGDGIPLVLQLAPSISNASPTWA